MASLMVSVADGAVPPQAVSPARVASIKVKKTGHSL